MKIRHATTMLVASGTLAILTALPAAAAPGAQHRSCRDFGNGFAAWVQSGDPGAAGQWMAAAAKSETGVSDILHDEQLVGIGYGPLCEPKDD